MALKFFLHVPRNTCVFKGSFMSSSGDSLKKLAQEFDKHEPKPKPTMANRTLSLHNEQFVKLQKYCVKRGLAVSHVVDKLIGQFLEIVKDSEED